MSYLAFCGIGLHNAQMYERSTLENRRNQVKAVHLTRILRAYKMRDYAMCCERYIY